jgi:hypothetical protein
MMERDPFSLRPNDVPAFRDAAIGDAPESLEVIQRYLGRFGNLGASPFEDGRYDEETADALIFA